MSNNVIHSSKRYNNIFQELMYQNPSRYAYLFQSYVQLTMLQLHTCMTPTPFKIMERSVYSAMCFVENLKRKNLLNNAAVSILEEWYNWCLRSANIETDLIGMYYFICIFNKKYFELNDIRRHC